MFGKVFGAGKRIVDQVQNLDMLQAISAASLYAVSGDGVNGAEFDQLRVSMSAAKALASFGDAKITAVLSDYRRQLEESPRMAKRAMRKECEDITDADQRETVWAVALDVASTGGFDETEKARLTEVAGWLRITPHKDDFT